MLTGMQSINRTRQPLFGKAMSLARVVSFLMANYIKWLVGRPMAKSLGVGVGDRVIIYMDGTGSGCCDGLV